MGRAAPREYIDLILCRDVYHCTPDELRHIPAQTVEDHLLCIQAERQAERLRAQHQKGREAAQRLLRGRR